MAEIADPRGFQIPTTPVKAPMIENSETFQEDTPGPPVYTQADPASVTSISVNEVTQPNIEPTEDQAVGSVRTSKNAQFNMDGFSTGFAEIGGNNSLQRSRREQKTKPPVKLFPIQPIYPQGDVLQDAKDHLEYQKIFSRNIEQLVMQLLQARNDLDRSEGELSQAKRDFWSEHHARLKLQTENDDLKEELSETQDFLDTAQHDLIQARDDKRTAEDKLTRSIELLGKTVEKLEQNRSKLRDAARERDQANRLADKFSKEVEFTRKRIERLHIELVAANKGEDAANAREARLTNMLFEVETQKARIEKEKDSEQQKYRMENDRVHDLENDTNDLQGKVSELEKVIKRLRKGRPVGTSSVFSSSSELLELPRAETLATAQVNEIVSPETVSADPLPEAAD